MMLQPCALLSRHLLYVLDAQEHVWSRYSLVDYRPTSSKGLDLQILRHWILLYSYLKIIHVWMKTSSSSCCFMAGLSRSVHARWRSDTSTLAATGPWAQLWVQHSAAAFIVTCRCHATPLPLDACLIHKLTITRGTVKIKKMKMLSGLLKPALMPLLLLLLLLHR